jgi:hypothetical protein
MISVISYRMVIFSSITVAILIFGYCLSAEVCEPEIFRRAGAGAAAVAALLVVVQVIEEIRIERAKRGPTEPPELGPANSEETMRSLFDVDPVQDRLKMRVRENQERFVQHQRIGIVIIAASCAAVGELTHGFGDLVVKCWK